MIRRKLPLDTKVLISAIACNVFYLSVVAKWPSNSSIAAGGVVADAFVVLAVLASIYGLFGTFFAGMSVGSRHSKRIKHFWEGDR